MYQSPGSQLRRQFLPSQCVRPDYSLQKYINMLKQKGVEIHQSLFTGIFRMTNNLEYPGIATNEQIKQNEILVKVPESLVLSSVVALEQKELQEVYKDSFYHNENSWEDRVLITYLLYLLQTKPDNNIWYHMLMHMSKQIDILCFWDKQELDSFKDPNIKNAALQDLNCFQQQWNQFQMCKSKHPIFQSESFTKDNYKWIYIHMISRCFGFSLDFISMVPFCEFFNHHISDVYYRTQKYIEEVKKNQEEVNEYNTSDESDESGDYLQQGQFDYESLDNTSLNWQCKQCLDLNQKQKVIIQSTVSRIQSAIVNICWKDWSVLFVGHIMEQCKVMLTQYLAGRKPYDKSLSQLVKLQKMVENYRKQVINVYKLTKNKKYVYKPSNNELQSQIKQSENYYQLPKFKPGSFRNFILQTGLRDNFKPNNQVYFCYGRRSNRVTLLHYGIALEGNKYDHVWISKDVGEIIKKFPDVISQIISWGLSRKRKFKIKHTDLNIQILIFLRLQQWSYHSNTIQDIFYIKNKKAQILVLQQAKSIYLDKIKNYQGNNDLTDPKISYHQYFIRVYHTQKIRILTKQIKIVDKLIQLMKEILKGQSLQNQMKKFNSIQMYMVRHYIKYIK